MKDYYNTEGHLGRTAGFLYLGAEEKDFHKAPWLIGFTGLSLFFLSCSLLVHRLMKARWAKQGLYTLYKILTVACHYFYKKGAKSVSSQLNTFGNVFFVLTT